MGKNTQNRNVQTSATLCFFQYLGTTALFRIVLTDMFETGPTGFMLNIGFHVAEKVACYGAYEWRPWVVRTS